MQFSARGGQGQSLALATMIFAIIALFSLLPMIRLLQEVILPGGTFSTKAIRSGLGDPVVWRATWNTIVVGIGGTVVAVAMGVVVSIIVTLTNIRMTQTLILFFVTPLMIAPQVTALAWLQLFGPSSAFLNAFGLAPPLGTPNPLYSAGGIIALLGIQYAPLVFLILNWSRRRKLAGQGRFGSSARSFCR